jgi:hypothetical protein
MGRAADPWRAAETWIRCLASHSVPLHAKAQLSAHPDLAHLPAEPGIWDRYDRSWRSRSSIRQASCSRPWLGRASCPGRHQGAGWFPLPAYRAIVDLAPIAAILLFQSHCSARPSSWLHAGPSAAHHSWPRRQLDYGRSTTFTVSLEGITDTQAAGIHEFCATNRYRARASGPQFLQRDCTARLPRTTRTKS